MKTAKKICRIVLDVVEIYLPVMIYICLFLTFVYQIFCRYVLRSPVSWSYELGLLTFVWTTMFGALYAWREDEHIVFSLVYDTRSERGKRIFDIIGAAFLLVMLLLIAWPTLQYVLKQRRLSSVLKISYKVMYFPFVIMIFGTIVHQVRRLIKAIAQLRSSTDERGDDK